MNTKTICILLLMLVLTVWANYAQEFTLTTTPGNLIASKASIDLPGLTSNPFAIIVATPLGETETYNPHPIGAWYYAGKWNLFNTNHANMAPGLKYKIQFFLKPGPNQFLHIMTQQNIGSEGSYIDHPALNNNPNAQFKILQNHSPEVRQPARLNSFKAKADYSSAAGRWYIANIGGEPLYPNTAYNIVINGGGTVGANTNPGPTPNPGPNTNPNTNPNPTGPIPTTPTPSTGNAGNTPNETIASNTITNVPKATPKNPTPIVPTQPPTPIPPPIRLNGSVDMHTHPMAHLGFGKRLLHGAPDIGSLVPKGTRNCNPRDFRAHDILDALGNCNSSHGNWGLGNTCGDFVRSFVITNLFDGDFVHRYDLFSASHAPLFGDHRQQGIETTPQFLYTPHQSSKVHQQMWWEWIKRAKEQGNLRVMVALAVNSELLAEILNGDDPKDDKAAADLQIDEISSFVGRHNDFMEVAKTPADLRRINAAGKLAVILGIEIDNIGNFNKPGTVVTEESVKAEMDRLYNKGVRYVFPIHLVNTVFGGTAVYMDLFNFANKYARGNFYQVEPSTVKFRLGLTGIGEGKPDFAAIQVVTSHLDALSGTPYPPAFNSSPGCLAPVLGCWKTFGTIRRLLAPDPAYHTYSMVPGGHINRYGLTDLGKFAIKEMMKLGLLIDIDHMSDYSQKDTLAIAKDFSYPINIGHNGLRQDSSMESSERHAALITIQRVAELGGVFGVGTADTDAAAFIESFKTVWSAMGNNPRVAIGTDVNGGEALPKVLPGLNSDAFYTGFPRSTTGSRGWDYTTEGVAHYGLMADFIKDIREKDLSVQQRLMDSAEYFALMWEKVERQKTTVK